MKQQNTMRNRELAQIHIAKNQLGMDDETYRAMIWTIGRVRSSAELDHAGRRALLDHLRGRGFQSHVHAKPAVAKNKQPLIQKIEALLADMKLPWSYAEGIAKQMYRRQKLEWCTHSELLAIVTALAKRQEKVKNEC